MKRLTEQIALLACDKTTKQKQLNVRCTSNQQQTWPFCACDNRHSKLTNQTACHGLQKQTVDKSFMTYV